MRTDQQAAGNTDAQLTCTLHPTAPLKLLNGHLYSISFECELCHRDSEGPAYHCKSCLYDLHPACCILQPTLQSWSHPHSLALMPVNHHAGSKKRCDGCRTSMAGSEWSYRCEECNFDLHARCAKLRTDIYTRFHPTALKLLKKSPYPPRHLQCGLCDERMPTDGWVYHCTCCKFDLHPSCALLPAAPLYYAHPHRLAVSGYRTYEDKSYRCDVCLGFGGKMGFRCDLCNFNIHSKCLVSSFSSGSSSSACAPQAHTHIRHPHILRNPEKDTCNMDV